TGARGAEDQRGGGFHPATARHLRRADAERHHLERARNEGVRPVRGERDQALRRHHPFHRHPADLTAMLLDANTRVAVHGITARYALTQLANITAAGTRLVAGVSPRARGGEFRGIPQFQTRVESAEET